MSIPHHSSEEFEAQQRFIAEMLGRAKPNFPQGKISENDQGEMTYAVAADMRRRVVILRFAKPVDWIGLDADATRNLGRLLIEKADQIDAPKKDE